jgi:hypothetical protein
MYVHDLFGFNFEEGIQFLLSKSMRSEGECGLKLQSSLGWTFSWATVGLGLGLQKWNGTERNGTGMLWFKSNGTWWWELKSKAGVSQCTGGSTCRAPIAFLPPAWLFSTTPPPPPSTHFSDRFERGRRCSRNPSRSHRRGEERSVKHAARGRVAACRLQDLPRQRLVSFGLVWLGPPISPASQ